MPPYALKDIKPNPFRHIDRYPIRKDKVAALRESLRATGFWGNVVARTSNGGAEIAYGHHRLLALKDEYGPSHKVDLIIRDLSDEAMLQMMVRENMEEWGTSAAVEHETIRAVVEAYAEGKIRLPSFPPDTNKSLIRYAPSFLPGHPPPSGGERPYTVRTVAQFIGWLKPTGEPQDKVYAAVSALQFIEEGLLKERDFEGLTTKQARAVVEEARKARERREAVARVHKFQAEQAEREAAAAQRRREEAERERRQKEIEAAKARDAAVRREAREEAERLARQQHEAEEKQREAERRKLRERQREREQKEEGRSRATTIGRAVSDEIKKGKIGYKQAADLAIKLESKRSGPPPDIEVFAKRLATDLNNILDPERDSRTRRLKMLVQYREYLDDETRADLATTLERTASRFLDYAKQLSGTALPTNRRLTG